MNSQESFELFWKEYPRKVGKLAAMKAWRKLKPELPQVIKALEWQKATEQWLSSNGQFIPHPATWLNQGRWMDEPVDKAGVVNGKPWYITASGIEAKARELGVENMPFPYLKDKVLRIAGVTDDMIRRAAQDHGGVK